MLPTGNLRDAKKQATRAEIIIVTKCPEHLSKGKKDIILKKINPKKNQKVFFTTIKYNDRVYNNMKHTLLLDNLKTQAFTLITGIANSSHIVNYLKSNHLNFEHLNFNDHHHFTEKEIAGFKEKKINITTEKDYMRLYKELDNLYYLPIETSFLFDEADAFRAIVFEFIKK